MKQSILVIFLALGLLYSQQSIAQVSDFKNGLSYKFSFTDYEILKEGQGLKDFDPGIGVELAYNRYLNSSLNVRFPFQTIDHYYPVTSNFDREDILKFTGGAHLLYKFNNGYMLKEDYWFAPYLFAGAEAAFMSYIKYKSSGEIPSINDDISNVDVEIPLGLGINWKLADNVYLQTQGEYRLGVINKTNNLQFKVGSLFIWGKGVKEPKEPEEVIEEPKEDDSDGDGIVDKEDDCPKIKGTKELNGCPDSDGDGIADQDDDCPDEAGEKDLAGCPDSDGDGVIDEKDACPDEKGLADNEGCPNKDKDGDGIVDAEDECPDVAGIGRFGGCPDSDGDGVPDKIDTCPDKVGLSKFKGCPDSDNDGVEDKFDKCPTVAGITSNSGCPGIKQADKQTLAYAMQAVEFDLGGSSIRTSSYNVMDQVADIMLRNDYLRLSIEGHTDSAGSSGPNQVLSEKRAKACYDYLVRKGVSPTRMSYIGYGEASPISDNTTKEGRQRNRRVEFRVIQ